MLDTSAVLRLHELTEEDLPVDAVISTVTLAELSVGPLVAKGDGERAARLAHVQRADADFGDPLPFDVEAARAFAQVAADIRNSGRKPKARAFDALIAATAKAAQLPLYTFNAGDLTGVTNLEVVALPLPHE
ncbi:MAG: PIN domain-containing protein [Nocardioides sp.]